MNKRLIWNFEINSDPILSLDYPSQDSDSTRWEARYFWDDKNPILLHGLADSFLNIARYTIKERNDTYFLLQERDENIKERRDTILYKPLLETRNGIQGFGKKINLLQESPSTLLTGEFPLACHELLNLIKMKGIKCTVKKTALIYKFSLLPPIKLELARLQMGKEDFFTLCIEGRSYPLVAAISTHVVKQQSPSDYVHFLKQRKGL